MSCKNPLKEEGYKKLEDYINSLEVKEGTLISVLHKAQEIFGYLPKEVQEFIGVKLELPLAKIYGVVSFYSFFTMTPKGKFPISVCMGTACFVRGSDKVLKEFENRLGIKVGEVTEDGIYSLDALRCVGACGLAPVVLVGETVFGKATVEDVDIIFNSTGGLR
jgi:NADH-quinone oxidoreductase subunit E/NADP-reducing hydrogenase subunit HndA